jgi:hypothetical protein
MTRKTRTGPNIGLLSSCGFVCWQLHAVYQEMSFTLKSSKLHLNCHYTLSLTVSIRYISMPHHLYPALSTSLTFSIRFISIPLYALSSPGAYDLRKYPFPDPPSSGTLNLNSNTRRGSAGAGSAHTHPLSQSFDSTAERFPEVRYRI